MALEDEGDYDDNDIMIQGSAVTRHEASPSRSNMVGGGRPEKTAGEATPAKTVVSKDAALKRAMGALSVSDNGEVIVEAQEGETLQFGDDSVSKLLNEIKKNNKCTRLTMRGCGMGDRGAKALSEFLRSSKTVEHVQIPDNEIGSIGATNLANALRHSASLRSLDICGNPMTVDGARALLNAFESTLSVLEVNIIGGIRSTDSGYMVKNSNKENASPLRSDAAPSPVQGAEREKGEENAGSQLALKKKTIHSVWWDPSDSAWTDLGRRMCFLNNIRAQQDIVRISKARKKRQEEIEKLKEDGVWEENEYGEDESSNEFTISKIPSHAGGESQIDDDQYMGTLMTLLEERGVETVNLSGIGLESEHCPAISGFIRGNKKLKHLNIEDNFIGDSGMELIVSSIVERQQNWEVGRPGSHAQIDSTKDLCLYYSGNPVSSDLRAYAEKNGVYPLAFKKKDSSLVMRMLGDLPKSLNLAGCIITADEAERMCNFMNHRSCPFKEIILDDAILTVGTLQKILDALTRNHSVRLLSLAGITKSTEVEEVKKIQERRKLKDDVVKSALESEGISPQIICTMLSNMVQRNRGLRQLDISRCKIDDDCIIEFGNGLELNQHLSELNIEANAISDAGAILFAQSVSQHPTLQGLKFQYNSVSEEGYNLLSKAIRDNNLALKFHNNMLF